MLAVGIIAAEQSIAADSAIRCAAGGRRACARRPSGRTYL